MKLADRKCVSWDPILSSWTTDGCSVFIDASDDSTTVCQCTHLTNFGIIFDFTGTVDRDNLAKVARIVFYRLDLSSSLKNIYKNVFGFAVDALEIVSLIFLEILSCS